VDDLVGSESPELAVAEEQQTLDLRRAILELEDDYREPLALQVLMGLTTEEIASQLGLTQAAVLTRLFRARQKLRKRLVPARTRRELVVDCLEFRRLAGPTRSIRTRPCSSTPRAVRVAPVTCARRWNSIGTSLLR